MILTALNMLLLDLKPLAKLLLREASDDPGLDQGGREVAQASKLPFGNTAIPQVLVALDFVSKRLCLGPSGNRSWPLRCVDRFPGPELAPAALQPLARSVGAQPG